LAKVLVVEMEFARHLWAKIALVALLIAVVLVALLALLEVVFQEVLVGVLLQDALLLELLPADKLILITVILLAEQELSVLVEVVFLEVA
jgi:hypothetical protein